MNWERKLEEAANFIRGRDDFLVVSHVQPDGDAISSTAAVGWLLNKLGKRFAMYNDGPIPSRLSYLWGSGEIATAESKVPGAKFRNVILVDCADYDRCGGAKSWFAEDAELLNIDHHSTNDGFGLVNLLQFEAAATAEILFDLIRAFNLPLDADSATAIYTGLMTDTGGFRYSNTSAHVMSIAARLLEAGADGPALAERLLERMSMEQMLIIRKSLARLTFSDDGRIGWLWVEGSDLAETGAKNEDLEGLVNFPRNVEGVEVGLLFKQLEPGSVKVSLRSAGLVNVAEVAREFGGGGHVRAAGCRLACELPEAIGQVVDAVQAALEAAS